MREVCATEDFHGGWCERVAIAPGPGRFEEAVSALRTSVQLSIRLPMRVGALGLALALNRNTMEARSLLERLETAAARAYVPPTSRGWIIFELLADFAALEWAYIEL